MPTTAAAAAAKAVRTTGERPRARQSAAAAQHAAAAVACPLGYEYPPAWTSWSMSGRVRSTISFRTFPMIFAPPITSSRKSATRAASPRRARTTTSRAITTTTTVLPRSVASRRNCVAEGSAWAAAHSATRRSRWTTHEVRRASNPTAPTARSSATAIVSSRPVASRALVRRCKNAVSASRPCSSRRSVFAVACTGPCEVAFGFAWTETATAAATRAGSRSATISTSQTSTGSSPFAVVGLFPLMPVGNPGAAGARRTIPTRRGART
jgi:hypothetical protein